MDEQSRDTEFKLESKGHLSIKDLFRLSVRAFYVRPMRTFLTILGMAVGIGTVFFLISLGYGLQSLLLGKLAPNEDALLSVEAFYPTESSLQITQDTLKSVALDPGIREVSPVAEVPGEIRYGDLNGSVTVKVVHHDYFALSGFQSDIGKSDCSIGQPGVIISSTALKLLNIPEPNALDKKLSVSAYYTTNPATGEFKTEEALYDEPIVGVVDDEAQQPYIYIRVDQFKDMPQTYTRFFARANGEEDFSKIRQDLISQGFVISARADTVSQARNITNAITIVLGVFGVAALIVSSIGMFNTMLISFMERIFEVGIMKSIGATTRDIRNLFLAESLIMGLLGGFGGILLGYGIGQLCNVGLNILAHYLGGNPVRLFIYPWQFITLIIILSGTVGVFSGFWPARKAAQLSAREAFLRK